jgi:hypothetical protein
MTIRQFLSKRKYELLLAVLVLHLFLGVVLRNLDFYAKVIWPVNMLILGVASIGGFIKKERWKNILRNILFLLVLVLPIVLPFFKHQHYCIR